MFRSAGVALALVLAAGTAFTARADDGIEANLAKIKLPPGFKIGIYAEVPGARSMAVGKPMGVVFVGTRQESVFAVVDRDKDRTADEVIEAMKGMHVPNGIAFNAGFLFVAEQNRIGMYAAPEFDIYQQFRVATIHEGLPDEFLHGWRTLAIGPDKKLYVAVGAPCNICDVSDPAGTIMRMNLDGSGAEVYARGVRNSVGMDFHPKTGELFFTDNGGDGLGDEVPADELNHAPKAGMHFGYPYHAGGKTVSPGYEDKKPAAEVTVPVIEFGAHHAALGIHFYKGSMFPAEYPRSRPATASCASASTRTARRWARRSSPRAGCRATRPGAGRSPSPPWATARCSSPTTTPASSTASATGGRGWHSAPSTVPRSGYGGGHLMRLRR
jgi:glucose/arabinose dehydrogenase